MKYCVLLVLVLLECVSGGEPEGASGGLDKPSDSASTAPGVNSASPAATATTETIQTTTTKPTSKPAPKTTPKPAPKTTPKTTTKPTPKTTLKTTTKPTSKTTPRTTPKTTPKTTLKTTTKPTSKTTPKTTTKPTPKTTKKSNYSGNLIGGQEPQPSGIDEMISKLKDNKTMFLGVLKKLITIGKEKHFIPMQHQSGKGNENVVADPKCSSVHCQNGGNCVGGKCNCTVRFTGDECEKPEVKGGTEPTKTTLDVKSSKKPTTTTLEEKDNKEQTNMGPGPGPADRTPGSSHFAVVFLVMIAFLFGLYALYHNRQKILAVVLEGRSSSRGPRERYRKLDNESREPEARIKHSNEVYVY